MKNLIVIPTILLVLVACTGAEDTSSSAQEKGSAIPANYISHTDETGLFTVSYPSNWEEIPNPIGVDEGEMQYLIEKTNQGILDDAGPVYFWGFPSEGNFNPICSLVVEPRDESQPNIQQVMDETTSIMGELWSGFQQVSLEYENIYGREVAILEYTATISETQAHSLVLMTIDGDVIWTNSCIVRSLSVDYNWYERTLNNIVRSLEIHQ